MKLNTKRTILVSLSFFLILAFWQAYDAIIPLTLTNKYGLSQAGSGMIMALDNILALFMLPLFGVLSDKTKTPLGKRTPYIIGGTVVAAIATVALSFVDAIQYKLVMAKYEGAYAVVTELYKAAKKEDDPALIEAAQDSLEALNQQVWDNITTQNMGVFVGFVALLLVILVAMSTFRSASVALMPDITPKPLRSKGNAIVNLVGYIGGIIALVLSMVLGADSTYVMDYRLFFGLLVVLMLGALVAHIFTVKENQWASEVPAEEEDSAQVAGTGRTMTKEEKVSFILLLASVVFWWMGYNAVATKFSVYSLNVLGRGAGIALTIGTAAAIISFIPVGILSGKLGRKKSVILGAGILFVAFAAFCFVTPGTPTVLNIILFSLAGIGWATINVNSFPMVVELASRGNVGKYTGYYYTASMAAQIATPLLSGLFMDYVSMKSLFPYSALFVGLSIVTMIFVKHGDAKPQAKAKEDLLELLDVDA